MDKYFEEKPDAPAYIALLDKEASAKVVQGVITHGRKTSRSIYVFAVSSDGQKVSHANFVSPASKAKGLDARTWAGKVSDVLGGKVGLACPYMLGSWLLIQY